MTIPLKGAFVARTQDSKGNRKKKAKRDPKLSLLDSFGNHYSILFSSDLEAERWETKLKNAITDASKVRRLLIPMLT